MVARAMDAFFASLTARRRFDIQELIFTDQLRLAAAYDAQNDETLETKVSELKDVDLEPLIVEWNGGKKRSAKYIAQLHRLILAGQRFPATRFRKAVISKFLADLKVDDPTRNRYRAALMSFAKWLVEREVIESNPVRDVEMYPENDPRMVWMPWDQSIAVAECAEEPFRTMYIVMAGTGMEYRAAENLRRQDVNFEEGTLWLHGTKKSWRDRVVRWEPFVEESLKRLTRNLVGGARVFPGITYKRSLTRWVQAQQASEISGHTVHDLRHTYAVNGLKKGYSEQVVAHQLGHKNTTMVRTTYGRYIPKAEDYQVAEKTPARGVKRG